MTITAPSLYTAFGDKESPFLECLEKYALSLRTPLQPGRLRWNCLRLPRDSSRSGMALLDSGSGSVHSKRVRAALKNMRKANQKALRIWAERDIREGRLPRTANPQALASMTMALVQGMSTLARDGAGQKSLLDLARTAMIACR